MAPKRSAGQRLLGHAAPGLISANGDPASRPSALRTRATTSVAGGVSGKRGGPAWRRRARLRQRQRVVDDVRPGRLGGRVVGPARQRLSQVAPRQADDASRAGEVGQRRRFQQPLRVDGDVVARGPQRAHRRHDAGVAAQAARVDRDDRREPGDVVEDGAMPDVDEPVDSRVGPGRAQRGSERQRVDDVAERAEADDQEGRRPAWRPGPASVTAPARGRPRAGPRVE